MWRTVLLGMLVLALPTSSVAQLMPQGHRLSIAAQDTSAYAQQRSWFSRDKALHFGISAAGAGGMYLLGRELGLGRWPAVAVSALAMGFVGVAREVVDPHDTNYLTRRFFSRRDLVWDAAGIVVGVSVADFLFNPRWDRAR